MKDFNMDKLNEVLAIAERTLDELKDENSRKAKKKRKRVTKAVEKAYDMLNKRNYSQKELDSRTDEIWITLMDDDHFIALLIFFFGFVLAGALIFTVFQAYSYIQTNLSSNQKTYDSTKDNLNDLVGVEYKGNNIISMYENMIMSDEMGLQTTPQEFTIKNDSRGYPDLNYHVNYSVNIVPTIDSVNSSLEKKYIKYKYIYTNSWNGRTYESKIGTLDELKVNSDGSLNLMTGTQLKDTNAKFKVVFWLSSDITREQQGKTYGMAFRVDADVVVK